ncbi:MAG: endonuclease III [Deltaproteobacteria bacterium]|nr:endonuclease III [Deltaproteobacteria bacterium]
MRKRDKARRVRAVLDEIFPSLPIPLDHSDPFTLLVAVVLSAQCTDKRVNLITPALFERAPDPAAMAQTPVAELEALIRTCGLYKAKAGYLAGLSRALVDRHLGQVPADFEALEALPGVGHKTASVVMSQAFGVPAFPVDTHILRLAARWGLSEGKTPTRVEADLKALFPESSWNKLHLQLIQFGRDHCPARGHDPAGCPICSWAAG